MTSTLVRPVLQRHQEELMAIPGVVGVAEGRCDGKPCIKIYVIKKSQEFIRKVPSIIEGIPVSIEVTGKFKALKGKDR